MKKIKHVMEVLGVKFEINPIYNYFYNFSSFGAFGYIFDGIRLSS